MRSIVSALSYSRVNSFSSPRTLKRISISFPYTTSKCSSYHRHFSNTRINFRQPADDPNFTSIIDNPPNLVRTGKRHGPGLIILGMSQIAQFSSRRLSNFTWSIALIPLTAFALGTWQVQRLDWKSKLIAKFEDRLVRDPLPLPPHIDPTAIKEFDYRRIFATGHFRHDQEMLIGPRLHDGKDGYLVITPLERDGKGTSVLVNRGWIEKKYKKQSSRPDGLPQGEVMVEGLLREPWKKNYFTPDNSPQTQEFYFPDVEQMAKLTGSQPVWIEETMGKIFIHCNFENIQLTKPKTLIS